MRRSLWAVALLVLPLLTGCGDLFPIEDLGFATLVAVDGRPGDVTTVAQVVVPTSLPGGVTTQNSARMSYHLAVGHGTDLFTAVRDADQRSSKRLYFGQIEAVFTTDRLLAAGGLPMVLDYFLRSIKSRDIAWLFVVRHGELERLMSVHPPLESYPARALVSQSEDVEMDGLTPPVRLFEVARTLSTPGWDPAVPLLTVADEDYRFEGLAVFRRARLVGRLSAAQSAGYGWLAGKAGYAAVDVPCPHGGRIGFEALGAGRRLASEHLPDGRLRLHVFVRAKLRLIHLSGCRVDPSLPRDVSGVLAAAAGRVRDEMAATLEAARALRADVFGFGAFLGAHDPAWWARLKGEWQDRGFPHLPVVLHVTFTLDDTGLFGPMLPVA